MAGFDRYKNECPYAKLASRTAPTQKLRRILDESIGYGLVLEGISAGDATLVG